MKYIDRILMRILLGAVPLTACELDIQLDPGELTDEPDKDMTDVPLKPDPVQQYILAVEIFEYGPPLQFLMGLAFTESWDQHLGFLGWTRRLSPQDRRPYGDKDLLGGVADEFAFDLDPAVYWTSFGYVEMTLHLRGRVVDGDFLCGRVVAEIAGLDVPPGAMTFAAQRLATSLELPDRVVVDCEGTMSPAY